MFIGYYNSPIGRIKIKANETKIIEIDCYMDEKENRNEVIDKAIKQLDEYFNKKRTQFDFPFELNGTEFQKKVWNQLLTIPFGKTVTYMDIAKAIGNEKGVRAVANAIGKNKHLILIPCHRVIGSNGTLTGFSAGIEKKEYLLKHENVI